MNYLDGFKSCPLCSGALEQKQIEEDKSRPVCAHCGWIHWGNPVPTASAVIPFNGGVILAKRKKPPQEGFWALAGGHVENGESPKDTVVREIKEETNLDVKVICEIGDAFTTDSNHLVFFYLVEVLGGEMQAGDDADELAVFTLDTLPENIAWTHHREAIESFYAGRNLRPSNPQLPSPQSDSNSQRDKHCQLNDADQYYHPSPAIVFWGCVIYTALYLGLCLLIRFGH
ncbi:MAG: NUDIX hydrolase [Candidatus Obscuribacterales bacterium]|nr:NUDIX hydrolase [Candidatus Obscuribacterales bacterium]